MTWLYYNIEKVNKLSVDKNACIELDFWKDSYEKYFNFGAKKKRLQQKFVPT
jgi:hypothetical protein